MSHARTADPSLLIPPIPAARRRTPPWRTALAALRAAWTPHRRDALIEAIREASLVGFVTLALSWGLAEIALLVVLGRG